MNIKQKYVSGIVNGKPVKTYKPIDISQVSADTFVACHCGQGGCLAEMECESFDTETTSVHQWLCPNCDEKLVTEFT